MNASISSRTLIITLVISLLIHSLLIIFLCFNYRNYPRKWPYGKQRAQRYAQPGSPILFMSPPSTQQATKQPQQQSVQTQPQPTVTPQNTSTQQSHTIVKNNTKKTSSRQTKQQLASMQHAVAKRRQQQNAKAILTKKQTAAPQQQASAHKQTLTTQPRSGQPAKPNMSQIARGFLDHMNKNGKARVTTLGNKNAQPTEQQLREERYLEKLNACLYNSFSIHRKQAPYVGRDMKNAQLNIKLDKEGNLIDLQLAESCGNRHVDQFIVFIFRDASSSFPPLPNYIQDDTYILRYRIILNNQEPFPLTLTYT